MQPDPQPSPPQPPAKQANRFHLFYRRNRLWLVPLVISGAFVAGFAYRALLADNIRLRETAFLYIPEGSTYPQVLDSLQAHKVLSNEQTFEWVAGLLGYKDGPIYPGRYSFRPGMGNFVLVRNLAGGRQEAIRLAIPVSRKLPDLLRRICRPLAMKPAALRAELERPGTLDTLGLDTESAMLLFIPNTYDVFWTIKPSELIQKLAAAYRGFWTAGRREAAKRVSLEPREVGVLASIVEAETAQNSEKPRIAGVYMNRLRDGMRLQADPTVIWAIGDFGIRRVSGEHTRFDSPYNTYRYQGLPPGPINNPTVASWDAVLNFEQHNYKYFVARPDGSGYHNFNIEYRDHLDNAAQYQDMLDGTRN